MKKRSTFLFGAFVLTLAGLISRFAGFFYRIFLSNRLGAEKMGVYQLVFPVYGICISLCCGSIQTALSRFIAGESDPDLPSNRRAYFGCALALSLSLAGAAALFLWFGAEPVSRFLLHEERCAPLLRMMALAVPVCAAHACMVGYFYGLQKTAVPAAAQVFEQAVRIGSVFLLYRLIRARGGEFSGIHAVYGLVIGELASLIFCLFCFGPLFLRSRDNGTSVLPASRCMRKLIGLAAPLTANRLCLSLMQSAEAVLIPERLRLGGLSQAEALGVFGTLNGMAMPFLLFPATLIHSVSALLLPEIAKAQAADNRARIRGTAGLSIRLSLTLGILCLGLFRCFGEAAGTAIFRNEQAGAFLAQLSFLCPFLYLSATLGSIVNGLGRADITFFHSVAGLAVRMAVIFFAMPVFGIGAYFYGMLAGEFLLTVLHLRFLCRSTGLRPDLAGSVFLPALLLVPSFLGARALQSFWLDRQNGLPETFRYLLAGACFVGIFLLLWVLFSRKSRSRQIGTGFSE